MRWSTGPLPADDVAGGGAPGYAGSQDSGSQDSGSEVGEGQDSGSEIGAGQDSEVGAGQDCSDWWVDPDLCLVAVSEVRVAVPASAGVEAGMVTLTEEAEPHREVGIVIGQPEARAISAAWNGTVALRPSPWDLLVSAVGLFGGSVERAVVTAVEEGRHFYASIWLDNVGEKLVLAARPSDAIAVALRSYVAIYVHRDVLDEVGSQPQAPGS